MEEIRQEFLNEAISSLKILQKDLQNLPANFVTDSFLYELFRRIHTIKGTSQTFDFKYSGTLAHEIENLLQTLREKKINQTEAVSFVIKEGIKVLLEALQNEPLLKLPAQGEDFIAKIRRLIPRSE